MVACFTQRMDQSSVHLRQTQQRKEREKRQTVQQKFRIYKVDWQEVCDNQHCANRWCTDGFPSLVVDTIVEERGTHREHHHDVGWEEEKFGKIDGSGINAVLAKHTIVISHRRLKCVKEEEGADTGEKPVAFFLVSKEITPQSAKENRSDEEICYGENSEVLYVYDLARDGISQQHRAIKRHEDGT